MLPPCHDDTWNSVARPDTTYLLFNNLFEATYLEDRTEHCYPFLICLLATLSRTLPIFSTDAVLHQRTWQCHVLGFKAVLDHRRLATRN